MIMHGTKKFRFTRASPWNAPLTHFHGGEAHWGGKRANCAVVHRFQTHAADHGKLFPKIRFRFRQVIGDINQPIAIKTTGLLSAIGSVVRPV